MSISKFNSEGYYDPVVYEALTKVEAEERAARAAAAYRPLVYICSPYAGDIEKILTEPGHFQDLQLRRTAFQWHRIYYFHSL